MANVIDKRPKHGCARCVWWQQIGHHEMGRCAVHREQTYYKHAACDEYELDFHVDDYISIGL